RPSLPVPRASGWPVHHSWAHPFDLQRELFWLDIPPPGAYAPRRAHLDLVRGLIVRPRPPGSNKKTGLVTTMVLGAAASPCAPVEVSEQRPATEGLRDPGSRGGGETLTVLPRRPGRVARPRNSRWR